MIPRDEVWAGQAQRIRLPGVCSWSCGQESFRHREHIGGKEVGSPGRLEWSGLVWGGVGRGEWIVEARDWLDFILGARRESCVSLRSSE